jgi:hypothetical protein
MIVGLATAADVLAASRHAVGGDRYEGSTSQGQATVIVVSPNGRAVTALLTTIRYDGLCGSRGGPPYQLSSHHRVAIGPTGNFAMSATGTTAGPGSLALHVTGTFNGPTVRGAIVALGSKGRCGTRNRHGNPYSAGFTAQGAPAVAP